MNPNALSEAAHDPNALAWLEFTTARRSSLPVVLRSMTSQRFQSLPPIRSGCVMDGRNLPGDAKGGCDHSQAHSRATARSSMHSAARTAVTCSLSRTQARASLSSWKKSSRGFAHHGPPGSRASSAFDHLESAEDSVSIVKRNAAAAAASSLMGARVFHFPRSSSRWRRYPRRSTYGLAYGMQTARSTSVPRTVWGVRSLRMGRRLG